MAEYINLSESVTFVETLLVSSMLKATALLGELVLIIEVSHY